MCKSEDVRGVCGCGGGCVVWVCSVCVRGVCVGVWMCVGVDVCAVGMWMW